MSKACLDPYTVSNSSEGKILWKNIKHDNNVSVVPQNILSILNSLRLVKCLSQRKYINI